MQGGGFPASLESDFLIFNLCLFFLRRCLVCCTKAKFLLGGVSVATAAVRWAAEEPTPVDPPNSHSWRPPDTWPSCSCCVCTREGRLSDTSPAGSIWSPTKNKCYECQWKGIMQRDKFFPGIGLTKMSPEISCYFLTGKCSLSLYLIRKLQLVCVCARMAEIVLCFSFQCSSNAFYRLIG